MGECLRPGTYARTDGRTSRKHNASDSQQAEHRRHKKHAERKCAENYVNSTINFFFKTTISILAISIHNRFPVLFDKIVSV